MKIFATAVLALAAGTAAVAPSDLLVAEDVPDGFELAVEAPTDLTFEEYAPLSPDATAHVDPSGSGAASMRAAVDVWTSADDDILLREVTRWGSDDEAQAFVEQAVVVGVEDGLDRIDPPFDGGVAYLGADEGLWTRTISWSQGPYATTVAHFGVFEGSSRIIDESATDLADRIADDTGHPVAISAEVETTTDTSSGGGIGIGTVMLWIVVIGGVAWLIMRLRRRRASNADRSRDAGDRGGDVGSGGQPLDDEPTDVDDIIERARARSRAEREVDAIPDPTEAGWNPPDGS